MNLSIVLIGNLISFTGAMVMIAIGLLKSKKSILVAQCFQFAVMGIGNLVLGGVTGFISNVVSIVRNLICFRWAFTLPLKLFFIALQILLSAHVNTMGLIGWLPIIAACLFTWFLDTPNEIFLKQVIILAQVLWMVYDFTLCNYASTLFDVLTVATTLVGIFRIQKSRQN